MSTRKFRFCLTRRFALLSAAFGSVLALWTWASEANGYPNRPIRIVVPAAAGGALDTNARALAEKMSEVWNNRIYVENRPGANFGLGMDIVARAAPDGYTLLYMASSGVTLNPHVFPQKSVSPADLKPIIMVNTNPFVLMVNKALPAKSASEFVDHLRANSGKLNHASNSALTMMVSELFKEAAKVDYVDINYRGASEALVATQGGTTQFCFVDINSATAAIKAGTMRPLALSSLERHDLLPEIPTFSEMGLPVSVYARTLLMAPANTPREVVDIVHDIAKKALEAPDMVGKIPTMSKAVYGVGPQEAEELLRQESEQWEKLVMTRNIKMGR